MNGMLAKVAQRTSVEFARGFLGSLRAEVAWRNRYAEDELAKAVRHGVRQYVILGAGLDSFAYRNREAVIGMQVFEVDLPPMQLWKKEQLHALGVEIPPNVTFLPLNFEERTLREGLQASGYRFESPGFFSWLAVTAYLTEDSIFNTLRDIRSLDAETEIVFEYAMPDSLVSKEGRHLVATAKGMASEGGKMAITFFDPADLQVRVQALGFTVIEDCGPEEANRRYFAGRKNGLRPFPSIL